MKNWSHVNRLNWSQFTEPSNRTVVRSGHWFFLHGTVLHVKQTAKMAGSRFSWSNHTVRSGFQNHGYFHQFNYIYKWKLKLWKHATGIDGEMHTKVSNAELDLAITYVFLCWCVIGSFPCSLFQLNRNDLLLMKMPEIMILFQQKRNPFVLRYSSNKFNF